KRCPNRSASRSFQRWRAGSSAKRRRLPAPAGTDRRAFPRQVGMPGGEEEAGKESRNMKRQVACLLACAVGLALLAGGRAQAAEITYTYKSLLRLDEPFSGTGETLSPNLEIGDVNTAGTVTGVVNYGDGEGGFLVDAVGKGMVLSRPGKASP